MSVTPRTRSRLGAGKLVLGASAIAMCALVVALSPALGSHRVDDETLGIGQVQQKLSDLERNNSQSSGKAPAEPPAKSEAYVSDSQTTTSTLQNAEGNNNEVVDGVSASEALSEKGNDISQAYTRGAADMSAFELDSIDTQNTSGSSSETQTIVEPGATDAQDLRKAAGETNITSANTIKGSSQFLSLAQLRTAALRVIDVQDPKPVVVLSAVDLYNDRTKRIADEIGTLNPLPTAPRLAVNTSGEGWMTGSASAYDLETNQGWDATASGVKLTRESVTVAVPESQRHLLGRAVEIVYGDKIVVATVTDTGGFAKYGRALDLAPGTFKALGANRYQDWGVRTVKYRFL